MAALKQDHVAGLGNALQLTGQGGLVRKGLSPPVGHAARNTAADHPVGAVAIGQDKIHPLSGDPADAVVLRSRPVSQFQHIAQNGNFPSLLLAQDLQRSLHGLGACIVAVLDQRIAIGPQGFLPPGQIPEGAQSLPDLLLRDPKLQAHSHGGHGIADEMAALQIHNYREAVLPVGHPEPQPIQSIDDLPAPDLAALVRAKVHNALPGCLAELPQHAVISVEQQGAVLRHALHNFHLGLTDPRLTAQKFNMGRADVHDHGNIRPADGGKIGHLPKMVHAHFQNGHLRILRHGQNRHGHTDVIIVVHRSFRSAVGFFQHRRDHLLRGALAHGAGDADDLHADALPLLPGDIA